MAVLISLRAKSISRLTTNHFFPSLSREFFFPSASKFWCIYVYETWLDLLVICSSFPSKNTGLKKCSQVRIHTYVHIYIYMYTYIYPSESSTSNVKWSLLSSLPLSLSLSLLQTILSLSPSLSHLKIMFPSRQLSGRCCSKDLSLLSSKKALVWWWSHGWIEDKRYPHCLWIGTNWAVSVVSKTW